MSQAPYRFRARPAQSPFKAATRLAAAGIALALLTAPPSYADLNLAGAGFQIVRAATAEDLAAVKREIQKGAPINSIDDKGRTALIAAANNGVSSLPIMEVLIENKARVDIRDKTGLTALMAAADRNCEPCVELLIKAGAPLDVQDRDGFTAFMHAARRDSIEVISQLAKAGAKTDLTDFTGRTSLDLATSERRNATAALLRKLGAKN